MEAAVLERRAVTAGAYVSLNVLGGLVPFVVGPTKAGTRLGVVRLGGHREPGETAWECARREASEEAGLRITAALPPAIYRATMDEVARELARVTWLASHDAPVPMLVSAREGDLHGPVSLMYLAHSDDGPAPAAEAQGLLLLGADDVAYLTTAPVPTLGGFLERGGRAVLARPLPLELPLEPFAQLRWLAQLLTRHPNLLAG